MKSPLLVFGSTVRFAVQVEETVFVFFKKKSHICFLILINSLSSPCQKTEVGMVWSQCLTLF